MNYTIENGLLKVSVSEDGAELKAYYLYSGTL